MDASPKYASNSALGIQVGGDHYKSMKIQPAEFIMANHIPWAEGSIIQYVARWRTKGGVEDLKKAKHLLDMIIEHQAVVEREQAMRQSQQLHGGLGIGGLIQGALGAVT